MNDSEFEKINNFWYPKDNKCMCCGKGFSREKNDNFHIRLYKLLDRDNTLLYNKVTYNWVDIEVARCENCKKTKKRAKYYSVLFSLGIGAAILIAGLVMYFFSDNNKLGLVLIVLGVLTSILLGMSKGEDREADYLEKKGVLSEEQAVIKYKEVAQLIKDGWSFGEPSPEQ